MGNLMSILINSWFETKFETKPMVSTAFTLRITVVVVEVYECGESNIQSLQESLVNIYPLGPVCGT
jgi:hypothetical protein